MKIFLHFRKTWKTSRAKRVSLRLHDYFDPIVMSIDLLRICNCCFMYSTKNICSFTIGIFEIKKNVTIKLCDSERLDSEDFLISSQIYC